MSNSSQRAPHHSLLVGDCLDILPTFKERSVQAIVTSPPYYEAREYDLSPTFWPTMTYRPLPDGDIVALPGCDNECDHRWQGKGNGTQKVLDRGQRCVMCGGWAGSLGAEPSVSMYIAHLVLILREVKRVLRDDGVAFINIGDTYAASGHGPNGGRVQVRYTQPLAKRAAADGYKPKDAYLVPYRLALALQGDGWYCRSVIVWEKSTCLPESVQDRPSNVTETVLMLAKNERYLADMVAVAQPTAQSSRKRAERGRSDGHKLRSGAPGQPPHSLHKPVKGIADGLPVAPTRNISNVWRLAPGHSHDLHFAVMPPELVRRCILIGTTPQACERCGAGWARQIERVSIRQQAGALLDGGKNSELVKAGLRRDGLSLSHSRAHAPVTATLGWQPACDCPDTTGTGRGVVLDPFAGSGTIAQVAHALGRDSILIEKNPRYADIITRRLAAVTPSPNGD